MNKVKNVFCILRRKWDLLSPSYTEKNKAIETTFQGRFRNLPSLLNPYSLLNTKCTEFSVLIHKWDEQSTKCILCLAKKMRSAQSTIHRKGQGRRNYFPGQVLNQEPSMLAQSLFLTNIKCTESFLWTFRRWAKRGEVWHDYSSVHPLLTMCFSTALFVFSLIMQCPIWLSARFCGSAFLMKLKAIPVKIIILHQHKLRL